ncbi:FAD/NAD(P)-binding domain-containing protein, partial [Aspergillus sclerotiicarbonarius CBS 121057]
PPPTKKKVIIVGAGPIGLFTALKLARTNIPVLILEKSPQLSTAPRAVGYHGAALAALKRTPVYHKARELGFFGKGICWRRSLVADQDENHNRNGDGEMGKKMGDIIASLAGYGHGVLYLPQGMLTRLIYEEVVRTGLVEVRFGWEVSDVIQHGDDDDDGVTAVARKVSGHGEEERFTGKFLVGADGGKSAVRKILQIPLQGHSWPERIVAMDVLLEDKHLDPMFPTSMVVHPVNFGLVTPLEPVREGEKTLYRCSVATDPGDERTDEELVEEASLRVLLEGFAPGPRPLDVDIVGSSAYRTHQLCAFTLRKGRCVLAGDAAHLNNPFGALGLTTGLLDADALANTLDMIINEKKAIDLLDVYADERKRVFQTFVDPVSTQNKLRCASDPDTVTEDWLIRGVINHTPDVMEAFGRPFFDVWPTDMRKLAALRGY